MNEQVRLGTPLTEGYQSASSVTHPFRLLFSGKFLVGVPCFGQKPEIPPGPQFAVE